ncbi:MAG: peptidoglycan DD-metalloendopeptidase family protein [Bacilli bacterium]
MKNKKNIIIGFIGFLFLFIVEMLIALQILPVVKIDKPSIKINEKNINYKITIKETRQILPFFKQHKRKDISNKEEIIISNAENIDLSITNIIKENYILYIYKDDIELYSGQPLEDLSMILNSNGKYKVLLIDNFKESFREIELSYEFDIVVNVETKISIEKNSFKKGDIIFLQIDNVVSNNIVVTSSISETKKYKCIKNGYSCQAMIPISIDDNVGKEFITVKIDKKEKVLEFNIEEVSTSEYLENKETINEYNKELIKTVKQLILNDDIVFNNKFEIPSNAKLFMRFGGKIINSNIYIQMDRLKYTENYNVVAINNGIILAAKTSPIFGNYIIIDHGNNILSFYGNLSIMNVKENETIEKGKNIGKTENSEDSYLDFAIFLDNVLVNPENFVIYE